MNNFIKLIVFIIAVALCVFISKSLTPLTPSEIVTSITYINDTLERLDNERDQLSDRINLGLDDGSKLRLLNYKYGSIRLLLDGDFKLSVPCDKYCNYLQIREYNFGHPETASVNKEDVNACYEKYYLSANNLLNRAETAMIAYRRNENITKNEYENIINDIKIKNEEIIKEVKNILDLTAVPEIKNCEDVFSYDSKPEVNDDKTAVYTKIGISKQCYEDCKNYVEAEGYLPTEAMPCSDAENKKIIEYSQTHPDMFE